MRPARASFRRRRSTSRRVLDLFADRIEARHDGAFDPASGTVTPTRSRRLGAIRLAQRARPVAGPGGDRAGAARRRARAWARPACRGTSVRGSCATARPSPALRSRHPAARRCGAARARRRMAGAAARGQAAAGRRLRQRAGRRARSTARLCRAAPLDRLAPAEFVSPAGSRHADRLCSARWPNRRSPRPGAVRSRRSIRRSRAARCRSRLRSLRPPAGRSRPPPTCPASGPAAGATSPRTCADATRNIRGPTIPHRPRRRFGPSARQSALDLPAALCHSRRMTSHASRSSSARPPSRARPSRPLAARVRAPGGAAARSAHRLERLGRHQRRRSGSPSRTRTRRSPIATSTASTIISFPRRRCA